MDQMLIVQDLALEVLDSDGSTVLADADVNGAGGAESLSVTLPGSGPYYVYVSGTGTEVQMYELSMDWSGDLAGVAEFGNVSLDDGFVQMPSSNFVTPRIVTGPPSYAGSHPVTSRVRHPSAGTWEWQLQEWGYLDGIHAFETAGYLRNVTMTGFEIRLQEAEASDGVHAEERVDLLSFEIKIEEEESLDAELDHGSEQVGYLVIGDK